MEVSLPVFTYTTTTAMIMATMMPVATVATAADKMVPTPFSSEMMMAASSTAPRPGSCSWTWRWAVHH